MTQIEFAEKYIAGNEGDIEDSEVQKLWIKYGFTNVLIESIDIFTNREVVKQIFESYIWESEEYCLKEGKINNIRKLEEGERVILFAMLSYPEKFWKIVNHYYNGNKAWISQKDVDKLANVIHQEEEKQQFLSEMRAKQKD